MEGWSLPFGNLVRRVIRVSEPEMTLCGTHPESSPARGRDKVQDKPLVRATH
jgi:hypothetical protein